MGKQARFIGGPFDGQVREAGSIAVSAETGEQVPPAFADRWLPRHRDDDPKVRERLRAFYVRQDYVRDVEPAETVYVWAAEYGGWHEREDSKRT